MAIKELVELCTVIALGTGMIDKTNKIVRSTVAQLPRFGAF